MTRRLLGATALCHVLLGLSPALASAASSNPGECFGDPQAGAVPPDCSLPYDLGPSGMDAGIPSWFAALAVLMAAAGIAMTIYRVTMARQMAEDAGLDPDRATAMTLLSDDGLDATYLASSLRGTGPAAGAQPAGRSANERLRELEQLRDEGLVSAAEYEARRQAILDSI